MRLSLLLMCAVLLFSGLSVQAEARDLSPACATEKERLTKKAKAAYQPLDTTVHDELMAEARGIERHCTDEKLLDKINARHARQQKVIVNLQQDLAKASEEKQQRSWIDSQTAKLRAAQEQLQTIEQERNALLTTMGLPTDGSGQETFTDPMATDNPAYNE